MVRWMRMHGKAAFGIELSPAVLQRDAPDLLKAGLAEQGSLTDLPYLGKHLPGNRGGAALDRALFGVHATACSLRAASHRVSCLRCRQTVRPGGEQ